MLEAFRAEGGREKSRKEAEEGSKNKDTYEEITVPCEEMPAAKLSFIAVASTGITIFGAEGATIYFDIGAIKATIAAATTKIVAAYCVVY